MKAGSGQKYNNGITIKPVKNRTVTVLKSTKNYVRLEFNRADELPENIDIPCASHIVLKGKVKCTGVNLSKESAYALMICLQDYFERVEPIN